MLRLRMRRRLLRARWRGKIAPSDPRGETGDHERGHGENNGKHAAERPVARLEELLLDHIADEAVLAAAEDIRHGEDAERGDEPPRRGRVHARQRKWKGDAPQGSPCARTEVLRRLEQG